MRDIEREFNSAFERYSDELFGYCAARIQDRERALEIMQETFLRVWGFVRRGQEVREYRPFLYRTLRNLIIDEYRKHKVQSLEAMVNEEKGETVESLLPSDNTNTLEAAMDRFDAARAIGSLHLLPEQYQETLTMRYAQGLSPKEIAEITGESENAISVRVHRGLKKLLEILEPGKKNL